MAGESSLRRRWTEEETVLALYLYFQLPYGKLHSGNPEIRELAEALNHPSNSIKMKLCNFASLDPKITESGRKGLAGASRQDREVYAKFSHKWSALVARAEALWALRVTSSEDRVNAPVAEMKANEFLFEPYQGASTTQALVNQRVGQDFFPARRAGEL